MSSLTLYVVPDAVDAGTPFTNNFAMPITATMTGKGPVVEWDKDIDNPRLVSLRSLQTMVANLKNVTSARTKAGELYRLTVVESRLLQAIAVHIDGLITKRLLASMQSLKHF